MKPALLLLALAALGFAQAGAVTGLPGNRGVPRRHATAPSRANHRSQSSEYRMHTPESGFVNRPGYGRNLNNPNSLVPPHGRAGR